MAQLAEPTVGALSAPALTPPDAPRLRLWAEFAALFIGAPLAIALFLPPERMFSALFAFTALGIGLLWATGSFDWRALVRGWGQIDWRLAVLLTGVTIAAGWAVLSVTRPEARFALLTSRPEFMALIWALYPFLSALPQELIFRALFFHRYGALMPDRRSAVLINAAVFSFAHLMYWNPIVLAFTFGGGVLFAIGYLRRGFVWAWLLHALAGNALFAVGMGLYFYSGNVVRPF